MAEVYTISGSALGAESFSARVQALKTATAAAKTSLVPRKAPAPASAPARLQNALRALGNMHGDPTLSKLKVDGVVGPGTTKAVNYAIAQRYVVMPSFPNPNLTVQHVRQFASGIAAAIEGAVTAGGGTLAPVHAARPRGGGGGVPAALPPDVAVAPESDHKWVWWVVGGVSVLVVLSLAASAMKKRRREPAEA